MPYHSPISTYHRKLILASAGLGAAFSCTAQLTFGSISVAAFVAATLFGAAEGTGIILLNTALRIILPVLTTRRMWRIASVFVIALCLHLLLAWAILWLSGENIFFMAALAAFIAVLAGELINSQEQVLLARETRVLQEAGGTRLPAGFAENCDLSPRESEVAELLYARASYKDIAERLFISMPTVKSHCSAIYRKTSARTRSEFIQRADKYPA
ncbi:MAG: helix-turn-helix transcriptional regulator [Spirochaetes bacterium]|nr:helix-turn-helix transcriptional regulator [Spirochaetota bacterium]